MPHVDRRAAPAAALACALLLAALAAPAADASGWARHAERETVEVITKNEDGSLRDTTVWIVVVDGEAFLRTGGTRWGDNAERNPELTLRAGEEEIPLRTELVSDAALVARVADAFRAKYGWSDRLSSIVRVGDTRILRLLPRDVPADGAPGGGV